MLSLRAGVVIHSCDKYLREGLLSQTLFRSGNPVVKAIDVVSALIDITV